MNYKENADGTKPVGLSGGKLLKSKFAKQRPGEVKPVIEKKKQQMTHQLLHGDCLDLLPAVPDASIDLVLADLPYDVTSQGWDVVIPMEDLWPHFLRVLRPGGKVVLTATNPFAAYLITSAPKQCPFKYEWVWVKNGPTNFVNAKKMPMRKHELVLVFQRETGTYNPQGLVRCEDLNADGTPRGRAMNNSKAKMSDEVLNGLNVPFGKVMKNGAQNKVKANGDLRTGVGKTSSGEDRTGLSHGVWQQAAYYVQEFTNYPVDVLEFPRDHQLRHRLHPTQKPVALFEYLIRTYTDEGATVLDVTAGSFTTTIAARNCGRSSVCMERDEKFYKRGMARYDGYVAPEVPDEDEVWQRRN